LPRIQIFGDDKAQKRLLRRWRRRRIGSGRNEDAAQATNFVIASASEAIQPLDCFVAAAPRKTGVPEKKMAGLRPA
jgi:hypothetical protein